MTDNARDEMLLTLSATQAEQGAILARLDRDVPQLFTLFATVDARVRVQETAAAEDSGRRSGAGSAWSTIRWVIGTVIAVVALAGGSAGISCILR